MRTAPAAAHRNSAPRYRRAMKVFSEWTVLPHKPIEKPTENLWRVTGMMGNVQRQMALAKLRDGRVMVINAIALEAPAMQELEAWGEPAVLVVPNAYHRQDARIWKQRYPRMTVIAPPKGRKRIERVVAVDHATTDAAVPGDDTVRVVPMDGCASDTLVEVTAADGRTLVFCDVILNLKRKRGVIGFLLGPTGRISTPRIQRWIGMQDKRAFASHVERMARAPELRRLLFGHGSAITEAPGDALRQVAAQLRGEPPGNVRA
jgi:hypothetical protein